MKPVIHCSHTEVWPINRLKPNPRNPNKHPESQLRLLAKIISESGWRSPIVVSKRSGFVVKGHGRLAAAKLAGMKRVPVDLQDYASEAAEYADLIADNRLAELAELDNEQLGQLLRELNDEIDIELTGYDLGALEAFLDGEPENEDPGEIEPTEDLLKKWSVQPGQLWRIGKHLLYCGDSSKVSSRRSVKWESCATLFYDPPWDTPIEINGDFKNKLVFTDGQRCGDMVTMHGAPTWLFVWDCQACWFTPNRPLKRIKICMWYGDVERYNPDGSHYGEPGESKVVSNSRGSYEYTPDPRGKHLADLFSLQLAKLHASDEHKHGKPVDWVRMLIANCTSGPIFDPFAGGGSTIIAGEQIGREVRAIEIEPANCASILERFYQTTGKKPKLA